MKGMADGTINRINFLSEVGIDDDAADTLLRQTFETIFFDNVNGLVYRTSEDAWCIVDTGNQDVRSEGMSYGMMMCVQMDRQDIFDKLWTFATRYMLIHDGPYRGYFAWSVAPDGHVNHKSPAPDGEEYFAAALFMASARWGEGEGIFEYAGHAKELLRSCLHQKALVAGGEPMWEPANFYIRFVPDMKVTDPSYHLPHFYEIFARLANKGDREFWKRAAQASREFLVKSAHPVTGLSPEYADYDGKPLLLFDKPWEFYSDAYRVMENIALDHLWFGDHPEEDDITTRIQDYFATQDLDHLYASSIDGTLSDEPVMHPVGLIATLAAASVSSKSEHRLMFLKKFVETPLRRGPRRYYDNCLYFLCLLILTGRYRPYGYSEGEQKEGIPKMRHKKHSLQNGRIAIFVNAWNNEFLRYVLEGVRKGASEDHADVFVYASYVYWSEKNVHRNSQLNIFHLPDPAEYDGAIVLTNTFNTEEERERACTLFLKANVPMISSEIKIDGMPYIGTDNYAGMHELAEHLIKVHQVKDVIYVSGIEGNEESLIRQQALEDALADAGLKLSDTICAGYEFHRASLMAEEWAKCGKPLPDAFVCANDHMALGMISSFHKYGIEVPRDVIITGFDHVYDARTSYPMLSTVSRQWENLGTYLYDALKQQTIKRDPDYEQVYPSVAVPSESCGCCADPADNEARHEILRDKYADVMRRDLNDLFFHEMRVAMSNVETREEFYLKAKEVWDQYDVLGPNFCICVERSFFDNDDEHYPPRIRGYGKTMDIFYEKRGGSSTEGGSFARSEVYPGYKKEEGTSNVYLFTPLSHMGYVIGYIAVKNNPEIFYDLSVTKSVIHLNALFLSIRQYILLQQNNRKLQEIYILDALSGTYNRTGCEKVMFPFIEEAHKEGKRVIMLFVDINNMKQINDDYGHLSGDLAIKACATALRDSLPEKWMIGRYGGDEFLAVGIPGVDPAQYRKSIEKRMKELVEQSKIGFDLTASIGWHMIEPEDVGVIEDFIRAADVSMYREKKKAHARQQ
ncbi:MAG: diguanylate cyclase [Lachnospiraceae bacterium]|nr:diguanylate cyclase [Lachnospiraceae bacterium]